MTNFKKKEYNFFNDRQLDEQIVLDGNHQSSASNNEAGIVYFTANQYCTRASIRKKVENCLTDFFSFTYNYAQEKHISHWLNDDYDISGAELS